MSIVLGGGISGLAATFYLQRLTGQTIKLIEGSSRVGGWIKSIENHNGTTYEAGPRTMRLAGVAGINTLELLEDLNLENKLRPVLSSQPAAKNRMLYVNETLYPLPNTFSSLFKTVPPFTKPFGSALIKDLFTRPKKLNDDTIHSFVSRRFGQEIADYAVSALVCGICAGDAKKISVNLFMGKLFDWEQDCGGVIKGVFKQAFNPQREESIAKRGKLAERSRKEGWNVWSLQGGLETLPKTLFEAINSNDSVDILLNSPCENIEFTSNEAKVKVNGKTVHAEHIFSGISSKKLANLLPSKHKTLSDELNEIPAVTVGVVNLEYSGNVVPVDGFGFLIPPNQKLPILGVIFDTCCFPQGDKTVLTVMMGGEWFTELFGDNPKPETLLEIAETQVKRALNITQPLINSRVEILKDCIPQYIVGHKARVERIRKYIKEHKLPITLMGASYDGVGVNDVILSARKGVLAHVNSK